jgi:hypothetical protein
MPRVNIVRPFRHCVGTDVYPTDFSVGEQEVDERTADVAVSEGWAVPLEQPRGLPSQESGPEQPASSPVAVQASQLKTSNMSAKRGKGRRSS